MATVSGNRGPGSAGMAARGWQDMASAAGRALMGGAALALLVAAPGTLRAEGDEAARMHGGNFTVFAGKSRVSDYGTELWTTDGTTAGTHLLRDIRPGRTGSDPGPFWSLGNGVALFMADDGVHGRELWWTTGVAAGLVANLTPGAAGTQIPPRRLKVIEPGRAVFGVCSTFCDQEADAWIYTGNLPDRARPLTDRTGAQLRFTSLHVEEVADRVVPIGDGRFLLAAQVPGALPQVWVLEGTQVTPLRDRQRNLVEWGRNFAPVGNGRVLFATSNPTALWITDGYRSGTRMLRSEFPGVSEPAIEKVAALGNDVAMILVRSTAAGGEDWAVWRYETGKRVARQRLIRGAGAGGLWGFAQLDGGVSVFQLPNGSVWMVSHATGEWAVQRLFRTTDRIKLQAFGAGTALFAHPHPRRREGGPEHGDEPWVLNSSTRSVGVLRNIDRRVDDNTGRHFGSLEGLGLRLTPVGPGLAVFPAIGGVRGKGVWSVAGSASGMEVRPVLDPVMRPGMRLAEDSFGPMHGGRAAFSFYTNGGFLPYPQIWVTRGFRGRETRALCNGVHGDQFTPLGLVEGTAPEEMPAGATPASDPLERCDD